jgi:nicotinamidase-related amidase
VGNCGEIIYSYHYATMYLKGKVYEMKPALMIIDLQKAYYNGEGQKSMDDACEYINAVIPLFREKGLPVIWVQDIDEESGVVPGSDCLEPENREYRIHKKYGNSFNKTKCKEILTENDVDTVIITGYCAEHCVLSTYRGALDQDLLPVILRNAIASGNKNNMKFVEEISNTISYEVLKRVLE